MLQGFLDHPISLTCELETTHPRRVHQAHACDPVDHPERLSGKLACHIHHNLRAGTTFPSYSMRNPCGLHLICSFPSCILPIPSTPSAGIWPASRVSSTSHLPSRPSHLPIPSHLNLEQASCPSHLPGCHSRVEMEIWVLTPFKKYFPGHASLQSQLAPRWQFVSSHGPA